MCPYCRTNAPLVYRGLRATCSGCGRERSVLSGSSLTHAGKPSEVGGTVVQGLGWATLVIGLVVSLGMGLLLGLFTATGGAVLGGSLAVITLLVFWLLRAGGKKLEKSGKDAQEMRRMEALFALAQNRGGVVQAMEAAAALDMPFQEADDFLTKMAKQRPDVVGVDVGEQGEIFYTFPRHRPVGGIPGPYGAPYQQPAYPQQGFAPPQYGQQPYGYAAAGPARVAPAPQVRVESAPQPRAIEEAQVVDAEFEAIDEAARANAARARR